MKAWLNPLLWPLPGGCQLCRRWGPERLCAPCCARFAPTLPRCPRCALRLAAADAPCAACLHQPLGLDAAFAAVDYAAPWDRLIQALKYHAQLSAAPALAELLITRLPPRAALAPDVLLLPVPLHPQRLRSRGFNQAERLARGVAQRLGLRLAPQALQRVLDTPAQAQADRAQRQRQLRNAFALAPGAELRGARVALVDDVMTTGATMAALATLLRRHGAAEVQAWVLARTPLD